jgi:Tol biopolymer transport system component
MSRRTGAGAAVVLGAVAAFAASAALAAPGDTELASVNGKGEPLNRDTGLTAISADGRYTTFTIRLGLQPGDILPEADVWMYDAQSDRGELISGGPKNFDGNYDASVSGTGRFTAFASDSSDLVKRRTDGGGLNEGNDDIFVYDRKRDKTSWVSRDAGKGGREAISPVISASGRFVAFTSNSNNLPVPQNLGSGKEFRVFVFDRKKNKTKLVSRTNDDKVPNESSWEPSISGDGRFVTYYSRATNLAGGPENDEKDVFLYDVRRNETTLVSVAPDGTTEGNDNSFEPVVADDGNLVAFTSEASNLIAADGNGTDHDVFVRDIAAGTTSLVSVPKLPDLAANDGSVAPSISGNGRYVAFASGATNLAAGDTNGPLFDIFRRDLVDGTTELVSTKNGVPGTSGNDRSADPALSEDGLTIAFASEATDLGPADGAREDVFVRELAP